MYNRFRQCMAVRFGIKPAILSEFIWAELEKDREKGNVHIQNGKQWYRCSQRMFTAIFPFMSEYTVQTALGTLTKKGVLVKACLNENKFDHTLSYAFTEYGEKLMKASDSKQGDDNG